MSNNTQPLRSFLFAPGNHARRVEKALTLDADAVILDLEDAVAIAEKPATREMVVAAYGRPRTGQLYVRVNAVDTQFCYGDFVAIVRAGLDGIILPKVETPTGLATIDWLLTQLERERGLPVGDIDLIPIIETARGLDQLGAILAMGTRVRRVAFGAGDFTLDVNMIWSRGESELAHARAMVVTASRAAGIEAPLDTVWVDLKDGEGMDASSRTALGFGFQGKMCIHPDQIGIVNRVFTPSDTEVAFAEQVAAAFKKAESEGSASIQLDGKFIDYPIVYRAQRTLERIAAIRARVEADPMRMRRAVAADLPAIVALLADDPLGRERETAGSEPNPCYAEAFAAIEGDPNQFIAVADRDGVVIGVFQLSFIPGLTRCGMWRGQIEGVRVAASERGEGVGRTMFDWAIDECRKRGCGLVQLTSDKRRPGAHRFYDALGFQATHEGYKLAL